MAKEEKYTRSGQLFHWVSALFLIGLGIGGTVMVRLPEGSALKASMYQGHVTFGLLIAVLTIGRLIYLFVGRRPSEPPMPRWERLAFVWNHRLLYVVIVLMIFSGITMLLLSGVGLLPTGVTPEGIQDVAPRDGHGLFANIFIVLFLMHVGGVLFYQFGRGGDTLGRMGVNWFSKKEA